MKAYNFSAGPGILPEVTIQKSAEAIQSFTKNGLSILEISHRSKEFVAVMDEAQDLFKELLNIPKGYHVLFLGGGASMQFTMIPYNLMQTKAAYLNTGTWSNKAIKEAGLFGETIVVGSSKEDNFTYVPKDYKVPGDADYFHITTNNTVFGTEIKKDIKSDVPIVADMSSDIFSRKVDIANYALIYGGAQKNLAPAGVTFVIVDENCLGKVSRQIPTMLDYRTHISKGSMFNTPPVLPIYSAMQTLRWIKNEGGVVEMNRRNEEKAAVLYGEIDRNTMFEGTVIVKEDRSIMNVTFDLKNEFKNLEEAFLTETVKHNLSALKGHRSVGGFRASIYNAMPLGGVQELVATMQEFEHKNS